MRRRLLLASFAAALTAPPAFAQAEPPVVFAAASLTDAMKALGAAWVAKGHPMPRFSFAASSALARQMEQGAPADIFASADEPWMDYAEQRGLMVKETRVSPLANSLVLIAPADRPGPALTITRETDILALAGPDGRIAVGDPSNVPVGKYAQAALTWMGQWEKVSPRLARTDNVRSGLLLVERGEAPLGIVYGTDAALSKGVKVIGTFPAESHPPVTYPFALTRRAAGNDEAKALFVFLTGEEARATFEKFGFSANRP
ncbi:molybdate ABC transporter substrate-binding protein [Acetobacteraceae bacterium H6797]|nr:molybdate ABC transporter substrate-binding protein [Acetobacteraceae bacterium H6797]